MKQRGTPEGFTHTANGLRRKNKINKPQYKKSTEQKSAIILSWFVNKEIVNKELNLNYIINEEEVETIHDKVLSAVLDELVEINIIKKYFKTDDWKIIEQVYATKRESPDHQCANVLHAKKNLDTSVDEETKYKTSIYCNYCCDWYHLKCTGLKTCPRKSFWMCSPCKNN